MPCFVGRAEYLQSKIDSNFPNKTASNTCLSLVQKLCFAGLFAFSHRRGTAGYTEGAVQFVKI